MKNPLLYFLLAISLCISCSDEDTDTNKNAYGFSGNPISGTLYGRNFTMRGGRAARVNMFNVESIEIQLSAQNLGCEAASGSANFPIRITAPRATGVYTEDVYVTYEDPDSDSYVSVASGMGGNLMEITSITETKVTGNIISSSTTTNNNINGSFEIPICQ